MLRTIIPGPPGTGKTHRLMYYLEHELKQTDPSKIAYIAFSNAAGTTVSGSQQAGTITVSASAIIDKSLLIVIGKPESVSTRPTCSVQTSTLYGRASVRSKSSPKILHGIDK